MKIMLIGPASNTHTKKWVNSLVYKGHDVLLLSKCDHKDVFGEINNAAKVHYLKFKGGIGYYLNALEARMIYNRFKPDIVNVHYASGYGTLARVAALKPLITSCWGSDVYEYPYLSKRNYKTLKKNLFFADVVASTSLVMADQIKNVLNNKDINIPITPFGVDVQKFSPKERMKKNVPVIGIVKHLEPIYDVSLLIESFSLIVKNEPVKPILEIYGDGSQKEVLVNLTKKLCVEDSVHFNGNIPNYHVPEVLNSFDVFVNCSKAESFGVAVVEAMSCGIPVVVTNTDGFREVVVDGKTGIVLKDRKPETMAKAISSLLHDVDLRNEMGKNGRKRVLEYYDWEKNVNTMENLYQRVKSQNEKIKGAL